MSLADELRAGPGFRLVDVDPGSTPGFSGGKREGEESLVEGRPELERRQELLFANAEHDPRSVLLVLQGMDTSGKGGIVRHVVGTVGAQGAHVHAFKRPTPEELAHDFLWRVERELPRPGIIGVFDRSHYEDVLIGRVRALADAAEIERRYGAIVDFEQRLVASGTLVVKCMLHISRAEQGSRLAERLERPDKYWKFEPGDLAERALWDDYQDAYQVAIERTSTDEAPWFVVPADRKWYSRLAVAEILTDALRSLGQDWPPPDFDVAAQQAALRASG
ncbi:PPK2 family polyphosphate kinase [Homoserinibacter sp. GY 40078]|uniref:PPK2 family polyphosphate kinase n=1 Tax=Homoserinibacter sp. GY 40078 TaxID=2603275 RepID=UPI0011C7928A|nr:PPK2 family polyphosphate kinase [Homoserinibacter sp. GY 40078]TXK18583.1 polyphosphate kinase 2 family protein [Homoserinibacter sp. GY 40078]